MTHPYTDPFGSGLVQLTPTQRLNNADLLRRRGIPGVGGDFGEGDVEGPLSGVEGQVGDVLGGNGPGAEGAGNEDQGESGSGE
jgi:hypothetical protein